MCRTSRAGACALEKRKSRASLDVQPFSGFCAGQFSARKPEPGWVPIEPIKYHSVRTAGRSNWQVGEYLCSSVKALPDDSPTGPAGCNNSVQIPMLSRAEPMVVKTPLLDAARRTCAGPPLVGRFARSLASGQAGKDKSEREGPTQSSRSPSYEETSGHSGSGPGFRMPHGCRVSLPAWAFCRASNRKFGHEARPPLQPDKRADEEGWYYMGFGRRCASFNRYSGRLLRLRLELICLC